MPEQPVYLHDIPLVEARQRLEAALRAIDRDGLLEREQIPLDERAAGRVLAEALWAKISSPHYHAAGMDGFAVRAEDTHGARPNTPVWLARKPGPSSEPVDGAGIAQAVDTGDQLPEWANAVIPIEEVELLAPGGELDESPNRFAAGWIRIRAARTPWQHVRPLGEDMVAGQLVLPAGQILRPVDLGAAAASGHSSLWVARQPKVAILPTGSELVPVGQAPRPGEIIEFNSLVLAAQVAAWGGYAQRLPVLPDDFDRIRQQVDQAASEFDLILLIAGSSAGSEDYSAQVVESAGKLLVHGVAIRPGHPVILGVVGRAVIIGVPGYPVSAALTGEIFVEPLLARWTGRPPLDLETAQARLTRKITSPAGDEDYLRVTVGQVGGQLLAAPLPRGAGVISSLARADGLVILPAGEQGLAAGSPVSVHLYRGKSQLSRTILATGSHDMALDVLAQFLAVQVRQSSDSRRLVSSNVGSLGGLVALKRGEAHLAGSHLLDPASGEYNLSYIRQTLPGRSICLVMLAGRSQGLLVRHGNPLGIERLEDLARSEVRFTNRQRGAGTRVLLDYQLGLAGIPAEQIQGYEQEEYTHLAVAAAVASGRSDVGLGIAAAAQALELDFIPLYQEPYQLVIPVEHYESKLLAPLLAMLVESVFRQAVAALPGYEVSQMGELVARIDV
jgi:putative molybdopterin biosynthesis protein